MINSSRGFTLIEVMMVVAIIAILAAIAVPAYQAYLVRARIAEALAIAEGPKGIVAENIASNGGNIGAGSCRGVETEAPNTANLALIGCNDATGLLTFRASPAARSIVLNFQPTAGAGEGAVGTTWRCSAANPSQSVYLPPECR